VLKLSSNGSDVFPKVVKLSSDVSECKPLPTTTCGDTRSTSTTLQSTAHQGLTLVHVRAQLEQLQDTFMS
jgi:hypothetical protein